MYASKTRSNCHKQGRPTCLGETVQGGDLCRLLAFMWRPAPPPSTRSTPPRSQSKAPRSPGRPALGAAWLGKTRPCLRLEDSPFPGSNIAACLPTVMPPSICVLSCCLRAINLVASHSSEKVMVGTDSEAVIVLVMGFWMPTIFFTLSSALGVDTGT